MKTNPQYVDELPVDYIKETFSDGDLAGYTTPGWYFWDETLAHCHGPFTTKTDAQTAFGLYIKYSLTCNATE